MPESQDSRGAQSSANPGLVICRSVNDPSVPDFPSRFLLVAVLVVLVQMVQQTHWVEIGAIRCFAVHDALAIPVFTGHLELAVFGVAAMEAAESRQALAVQLDDLRSRAIVVFAIDRDPARMGICGGNKRVFIYDVRESDLSPGRRSRFGDPVKPSKT